MSHKTMERYTIVVHNRQGASDQVGNLIGHAGVNRYLRNEWSDPENLTAEVRDSSGNLCAEKRFGRKTLVWFRGM